MSHFSSVCQDSGEDVLWRHRSVDLLSGERRGVVRVRVSERERGLWTALLCHSPNNRTLGSQTCKTGEYRRAPLKHPQLLTDPSVCVCFQFRHIKSWSALCWSDVFALSITSSYGVSTVASSEGELGECTEKVQVLLSVWCRLGAPDGYGCLCSSLHMWRCYVDVSVCFSIRGTWGLLAHQTVTCFHVLYSQRDCFEHPESLNMH